jgi:nitrile hydratase accessory protein
MSGDGATVRRAIADVLPRRSGELTFQSEWERRAFGLALGLIEHGHVSFDEFRWQVVSAIGDWQRANQGREESYRFYAQWLEALEKVLSATGTVSREEIDRKMAEHPGDA